MKRTARLLAGGAAAMAALTGLVVTAVPASAANWNIPHNIRYPFSPMCDTHMNPFNAGYGTMTCKGIY